MKMEYLKMRYKVGDKVRIDPNSLQVILNGGGNNGEAFINTEDEYVILKVEDNTNEYTASHKHDIVTIEGIHGGWYAYRFISAEKPSLEQLAQEFKDIMKRRDEIYQIFVNAGFVCEMKSITDAPYSPWTTVKFSPRNYRFKKTETKTIVTEY